jgi:hypothetical protein
MGLEAKKLAKFETSQFLFLLFVVLFHWSIYIFTIMIKF